jgi:hypothetical protein
MQLRSSTLLTLAVGALLIASPGLDRAGGGLSYDQAFAAKGGNGKGNGGGNGNGASSNRGGNSASSNRGGSNKSLQSFDSEDVTDVASLDGSNKKTKGPDHPSSLGRWNATKDFMHPSIQAHIRNGNFNGTIGMLARFGLALNTLGGLQAQTDATAAASEQLAAALQLAGYGVVDPTIPDAVFDLNAAITAYNDAVIVDPTKANADIDAMIAASQALPSAEDLLAAQTELTSAEAEMAAASNRAPWEEVRSVVIERLGLEDPTVTEPTTP